MELAQDRVQRRGFVLAVLHLVGFFLFDTASTPVLETT
jgi:hypothetical protein